MTDTIHKLSCAVVILNYLTFIIYEFEAHLLFYQYKKVGLFQVQKFKKWMKIFIFKKKKLLMKKYQDDEVIASNGWWRG